jgi:lipoate-protein ligase B
MLEQGLIQFCHGQFNISASGTQDTGVWVENNKIAAIGTTINPGFFIALST